jgi:predicted permease
MRHLARDVRYGARMLRRRPGSSAIAVLTIASGIGLTTTVFSIVDGAFLRGLPFDRPGEIVQVSRRLIGGGRSEGVPPHDFVDWRSAQHAFEDLAGSTVFSANVSTPGQPPERYRGARITPNTLAVLRVAPAIGRPFVEADAQPDAASVAIISDALWRARFGASLDVLGRPLLVNGVTVLVVGVMPPRFGFPVGGDLWIAERLDLGSNRGEGRVLDVIARLKPGVSVRMARADLAAVARRLADLYPENHGVTADVRAYTSGHLGPEVVRALTAMLGVVFGVLLMASVNVMHLQIARSSARTREFATRFAIGATPARVARQLVVESALLSSAGAILGVIVARAGIGLFNLAVAGRNVPFWMEVRLDFRTIAFAAALAAVTTVASSLAPALRAARPWTGFRIGRTGRTLVAFEMTLSFALLFVTGLLGKSAILSARIVYPFSTDAVVASASIPERDYHSIAQGRQLVERILDRAAAVPGVTAVAAATSLPDEGTVVPIGVDGSPVASGTTSLHARRVEVSSRFFDVMSVPILAGRSVADRDRTPGSRGAVVTDALARRLFPGGSAVGGRIRLGSGAGLAGGGDGSASWTIVGTVPSVAADPEAPGAIESVFVPFAETEVRNVLFFAAAAQGLSVGPSLRRAVMEIDRNLPLASVETLGRVYDRRSWRLKVFGGLFLTFGAAALIMAAAGLYGVTAFAVRERTREIGIRAALGATRTAAVAPIVRQAVWQVGVGIGAGVALGAALAHPLRLFLFRVSPWDPWIGAATAAVVAATGIVASYLPARRAASVDPLEALRHD